MTDIQKLSELVSRLEAVTRTLESGSVSAPSQVGSSSVQSECESVHPRLQGYDNWIAENVEKFIQISGKIGGDVVEISELLIQAIAAQRLYIQMGTKCSAPGQSDLPKLLQTQTNALQAIGEFRNANRRSKVFNHLSAISESIPALGWVCVSPAPVPYIKEMIDSAVFYTNRILKEYKDKDQTHVDWTKSLVSCLNALMAYVKEHHTTGMSWNPKGPKASLEKLKEKPSKSPKPARTGGAGAPPPPPCPPPADLEAPKPKSTGQDSAGALFSQINNLGAEGITGHLKKVPRGADGKRLKPQNDVPKSKAAKNTTPVKKQEVVKAPVFACEGGKKWFVEHQKDNHNLSIDANMTQTVYIFKCENCTVQVHGKCNSITADMCKKINIVFDNAVAQLEVINGQSIKCQVMGNVPTVSVEKTDGFHMYLSKESLNAQFITAKSSEMNLSVPNEQDEFTEFPLPEQFKTVWRNGNFVTVPNDGH